MCWNVWERFRVPVFLVAVYKAGQSKDSSLREGPPEISWEAVNANGSGALSRSLPKRWRYNRSLLRGDLPARTFLDYSKAVRD